MTTKPRRTFPWIRILIVLAIVGVLAYLFVPNLYSVRADALVRGDLVPVSSEFRARLDRLLVGCTRSVHAGEPVAIVSNFLLQADYQHEYLQSEEQSELANDALQQNVATASANALALREKYESAQLDVRRLQGEYNSYNQAYFAGAVPRVTRDAKRIDLQNSQALAAGALAAWTASKLYVAQITAAQESKIGATHNLLQQTQAVQQRLGRESIKAPVTGDIVDCIDRPQIVLEAGVPLFDIFPHDKAYIVAYFNPDAVAKVRIGEKARVDITGLSHDVTGRVAWIYPNLDALPDELTRFFWQRVQFSEYRPVKITLDDLRERERAQLYYNAQARVSINTAQHGDR